jgi:hypothetical protein
MRISSPSANWLQAGKVGGYIVTWTVSIKKTTDLTEALSAGTWVDVTGFLVDLPDMTQQIEYELGQFSSGSLGLTGRNIDWWEANIFNASESQYLELKVVGSIGASSTTMTSDTFYAFSGYIDKEGVSYDEIGDTVDFTVFTADDLGNRMSVLNVNTQYISDDIDGSGTDGLILPQIPGVWVKDANITSFVLQKGLHTITYTSGPYAQLDDGDPVGLANGDITLINGDGDQKLMIYVDTSLLDSETRIDYVIVTENGNDLPQQPFYSQSLKTYLRALYETIGITSVTYDTLTLNSYDSTRRISFYDIPPDDSAITGNRFAVVDDGTNMWVSVGAKIYKYTISGETYTLKATITSGAGSIVVKKLLYNSRNNDLWIFYTNATNGDCVRRYDITGDSLSSEVIVYATANTISHNNVSIVDDNYTGSSYLYGFMAGVAGTALVKFVDDPTLTSTTVVTMAQTITARTSDFHYQKATDEFYFKTQDGGPNYYYNKITITGAGAWSDIGPLVPTTFPQYTAAAYHASEDRIYYFENGGDASTQNIKSHPHGSVTPTTVVSNTIYWTYNTIVYDNSKIYAVVGDETWTPTSGTIYEITSNTVDYSDSGIYTKYSTICFVNSRVYGVDFWGRLFQWYGTINMFLKSIPTEGTIKDALNKVLQSYNLMGIISSHKKAFVYRRANDSGTIQTTGSNMVLTTANVGNIQRLQNAYKLFGLIKVDNGTDSITYDGTNFNNEVFSDIKRFELSNEMMPDSLLNDLAYYFYTFYSSNHDKYLFEVNAPLMEYEVMDGADVTFTTTKIVKDATSLITSQTIKKDGRMTIEVLF